LARTPDSCTIADKMLSYAASGYADVHELVVQKVDQEVELCRADADRAVALDGNDVQTPVVHLQYVAGCDLVCVYAHDDSPRERGETDGRTDTRSRNRAATATASSSTSSPWWPRS
jgi:hypothetical protein